MKLALTSSATIITLMSLIAQPVWSQVSRQEFHIYSCEYDKALSVDEMIGNCTRLIESKRVPVFYIYRASHYIDKGLYDMALADYSAAIVLEPDNSDFLVGRGRVYERLGHRDKAMADYQAAVKMSPDDDIALEARGELYEKMGLRDKAMVDYQAAIKLNSESNDAIAGLKRVTPSLAGPALADQTSDQLACESSAASTDARIAACTRWIQSGNPSDAGIAKAFNNRGAAYADRGEYDRAIQDFDQAIQLKPDYAEAFNNRGLARDLDYDRAIQDYDQAIRLKPDYAEAFNNRGAAYADRGEYDRAIQDFDQAIQLKPDYAEAFFNRGYAYFYKDDLNRAIQDYDQAIRLKPDLARAFYFRGLAYELKGAHDRAIQDYGQAIRLHYDTTSSLYRRGFNYAAMGDLHRAIQDYDQIILLRPEESSQARASRDEALATLASSQAAAPVRPPASPTQPKPAGRPSTVPKAVAAQPSSVALKGDFAAEVLAKLEQTKEYSEISSLSEARARRDPSWPSSALGRRTADILAAMRADAQRTAAVRTTDGVGLEYYVSGKQVIDSRIPVKDLNTDKEYRDFVAGSIATVISAGNATETLLKELKGQP